MTFDLKKSTFENKINIKNRQKIGLEEIEKLQKAQNLYQKLTLETRF